MNNKKILYETSEIKFRPEKKGEPKFWQYKNKSVHLKLIVC